ncbi:hypothetical protein E3N88_22847 [Mikania micrantha]|uniref:Uncharacterized protein n=1 Tax=Mikania micrantha TaxID=192012 RepID=A0A5N6NBL6_9ASTR|nr:hypothetical protein E3N88_22847 [Mikania micrantha]
MRTRKRSYSPPPLFPISSVCSSSSPSSSKYPTRVQPSSRPHIEALKSMYKDRLGNIFDVCRPTTSKARTQRKKSASMLCINQSSSGNGKGIHQALGELVKHGTLQYSDVEVAKEYGFGLETLGFTGLKFVFLFRLTHNQLKNEEPGYVNIQHSGEDLSAGDQSRKQDEIEMFVGCGSRLIGLSRNLDVVQTMDKTWRKWN